MSSFSRSTTRELRDLNKHGAPLTAILREVCCVLGDPGAFKRLTAASESGRFTDSGRERGPLLLTGEDAATVHRLGLNADRIASMSDDTNYEDWKGMKAQGAS